MNTESKVALGVLAGLAAGAVLGVLFAPAKGSETRAGLIGKGNDLVDGAKEKLNEFKDAVTERISSATGLVSELAEEVVAKPELAGKAEVPKNTQLSNERNHQNSVTNQNRH